MNAYFMPTGDPARRLSFLCFNDSFPLSICGDFNFCAFSSIGLSVFIVHDSNIDSSYYYMYGEKNPVNRGHSKIHLLRSNSLKIESRIFKINPVLI